MRRWASFWHTYTLRRQERLARLARFHENRRRQLRAARRRRDLMRSASPLQKARLERIERARLERKRDRNPGNGILINLNLAVRRQEGSGAMYMIAALLCALLISLALLLVPIFFVFGILNYFVSAMFDLPGVQQLISIVSKAACSQFTSVLTDVTGAIFDISKFIPAPSLPLLALNFLTGAINTGGEYLEKITEYICIIVGNKKTNINGKEYDSLLTTFKQNSNEKDFESELNCSNWDPVMMGGLDSEDPFLLDKRPTAEPENSIQAGPQEIEESNSKKGKPQFCLDDKDKKETQSLVPEWLIPIYQAAAAKYNLPWELLAAINWNDTSYGAKEMNKDQEDNKQDVDKQYSDDMQALEPLTREGTLRGSARGTLPDSSTTATVEALRKRAGSDKKVGEMAKAALEAATTVSSEWQQENPLKLNRAGWIPLSRSEWDGVDADEGAVPLDWSSSPYPDTKPGSAQACPGPVDIDGNMVIGAPGEGGDLIWEGKHDTPKVDVKSMPKWPGDDASEKERAQWIGNIAKQYRVPPVLLVTAALQESGMQMDNTNEIGATGIFQMYQKSEAEYPNHKTDARQQMRWAIIQYYSVLRAGNEPGKEENWGHWISTKFEIAATDNSLDNYYQKRIPHARKLLKGMAGMVPNAEVDVSFIADGERDTCDPVDSIFALAHWLSNRGARGELWREASQGRVGNTDQSTLMVDEDGGTSVGGDGGSSDLPVFIEGDSLSVDAKDFFKKEFGKRLKDKNFDAMQNRQVQEGIQRVKRRGKDLPDVLVFALGANSLGQGDDAFKGWVSQVMKAASGRCVVWPTVYAGGGKYVKALNDSKEKYSNLVVPDWHRIAGRYIYPTDKEQIHVTPAGSKAYAKLMKKGVDDCEGGSGKVSPPKSGKLKGRRGEIRVIKSGKDLLMYSGASNYASAYRNKRGEIPRKGPEVSGDPNDNNISYCEGGAGTIEKEAHRKYATNRYPGVAIKVRTLDDSGRTACGYWEITAPNGKRMVVMQSDKGPGAVGAHLDINSTLAQELGYKTGNSGFPSYEGLWSAKYLGKKRPANVNQLTSGAPAPEFVLNKTKLDTDPPDEFRADSVPPLDQLKKKNPDLPNADWVSPPKEPLEFKFPSFDSGLRGDRRCGELVIKPEQLGVFYSAGKAFKIPWQVLVGYAGATSNYGCRGGTYSYYRGSYATDADGSGAFNPADPVDSVFSTARSLYAYGGSEDIVKAVREMTADRSLLADVAEISLQLGYNSAGFTELMDSAISLAVEARDHLIDKEVCKDFDVYVECIAELYRKIRGEESVEPGDYLTGGCKPDPAPDQNLEPYSLNKQARSRAAYKQDKGLKKVYESTNVAQGELNASWVRKDALAGYQAALRTFIDCFPKWKKKWQQIQANDWGAVEGPGGSAWAPEYEHKSHRVGSDNDLLIPCVTDFVSCSPLNRKESEALARMFLRSGAYRVIFDDPKVAQNVNKAVEEYGSKHRSEVKRLGVYWSGNAASGPPVHDKVGDHSDHFHVSYGAGPNTGGPGTFPAKVKVWVTDKAINGDSASNCEFAEGYGPYSGTAGGKKDYVECRNGKKPKVIIIHTTDYDPETSLPTLFKNLTKDGLSIHAANDKDGKDARMVSDIFSAQHATHWNETSLGIEQMGHENKISRSEWLGSRRDQLNNTAAWVAYWSQRHNINFTVDNPCRTSGIKYKKTKKGNWKTTDGSAEGVCAHGPLLQKDKKDPGANYPWREMLTQAKAYISQGKFKTEDPAGYKPGEIAPYDPVEDDSGDSDGGSGGGGSGGSGGGGSGGSGGGGSGRGGSGKNIEWPQDGVPDRVGPNAKTRELMDTEGPIPGWCWFHYRNSNCDSSVGGLDYKKKAQLIMKKAGCKNFRGRCGEAVQFLVDAQNLFSGSDSKVKTASRPMGDMRESMRSDPGNPYSP